MQETPGGSRGTSVLTSHEQCDHDMRYFVIRKRCSVAVRLTHQGTDHIRFVVLVGTSALSTRQKMDQRTLLVPSFLALMILI